MKPRLVILAWKIIVINYTWLLASMRWRQSLCVQMVFMWSEHARRVSSAP